jgi:hypothetical protein
VIAPLAAPGMDGGAALAVLRDMLIRFALALVTVVVLSSLGACGQSISGRACSADDPCPDTHHCIQDRLGDARCMADCSGDDRTLCSDGSFCATSTTGDMICWLGGSTAIGSACTSNTECVRGGLCVGLAGGTGAALCFQGCNNVGGTCPSGGTCQMTLQGNGFCSR